MTARPGEPQNILIIRISAMGDLVFATPLLASLRARFPNARISWLVRRELAPLLEGDAEVDEVIPFSPPKGKQWPSALLALRRQLRDYRFDWVIDAQGLLKTRLLAWAAGGHRIGFDSKEPAGWLMHERLPKGGDVELMGSEYRWLAEQLTDAPSPPPRLRVSEEQATAVHEQLETLGVHGAPIVVCPFTTRPQKHWPQEYWPELITGLIERFNAPVLMLGGPADREAAAQIEQQLGPAAVRFTNLVGQTRIAETPAWMASARLVIGVDTGLTHMGGALGRPTVALFGSTCPYTGGARGPLTVMYDKLPCAPCRRNPTCAGVHTCLRLLTPARVIAAARALLAGAETA